MNRASQVCACRQHPPDWREDVEDLLIRSVLEITGWRVRGTGGAADQDPRAEADDPRGSHGQAGAVRPEAGVESAREQRDDRCAPQRKQHVAHGV